MSFTTVSNTNTPTIFLTPSKRQRATNETQATTQEKPKRGTTKGEVNREPPSAEEIWGWTMTSDAVATCSAKDVYDMKENLLGGADFYWLGRVPCRTVRLVGLVVGVRVFESRVVYSIDDGTAVIDCAHRASKVPKSPTKKPKQSTAPGPTSMLREMPIPIARVGRSIRVVGKVHRVHDTRQIQADEIEICKSVNEEPLHWRKVRQLHKTCYDSKEPFFILPPSAVAPLEVSRVAMPSTPSTVISTPTSSVASSPVKPGPSNTSPPKLRHPSRLRSHDLTDNTFRIYVKHYMIYAPNIETNTELDIFDDGPATPTKCRLISSTLLTPAPMKTRNHDGDRTPCSHDQRMNPDLSFGNKRAVPHRGFTLSYLRRVPELADLARRVVLAEAKRKNREQKRKENAERSHRSASRKPHAGDIPKLGTKTKRLFVWVVVQMMREGSIVLWDGPVLPCNSRCDEISQLWKTTSTMDSSIFSVSCGESRAVPEDDVLSEPDSNEEGYMPVTPLFLADYIEKAIRDLVSPVAKKPVSKFGVAPTPVGATKEGILTQLRKDDRWRYIGEWQVQDALEFLRQESRVWCVGTNRWELTL